jgi:hypothetical protein
MITTIQEGAMRTCRSVYVDERDKLIPEALKRTEAICGVELIKFETVPMEYVPTFFHQMDDLAKETWLVSRKQLPVSNDVVRRFLEENNILPARSGKIVIHCGPKSVGGTEFASP